MKKYEKEFSYFFEIVTFKLKVNLKVKLVLWSNSQADTTPQGALLQAEKENIQIHELK